jgi:hypothetical protein
MRLSSTREKHRHQGSRATAVLVAALALLIAPLCSAAAAAPANGGDGNGLRALGATVIAAIGTSSAGEAVDTIGNSLALLGARYRIEDREARNGGAAAGGGAPDSSRAPWEGEDGTIDPSKLPPASAGSNGTHVPHTSAMSRDEIFAHTRAGGGSTAILLAGVALAPPDAPEAVKNVVNNANTIVGRPYIWGGGHASWYSHGYDCSGSVSFALFGGGLIPRPLTSSELEGWGAPGPGKWITVYANARHTFAEVAGLRWDTVGDEKGTGPRWHLATTSTAGFVVRHPPPIADIVRSGWTKPGSLTWCFSSLRQTASRTIRSSSASSAPARSGSRRSVSRSEKRQVRSRPSAVSRIRLQSAQNGSLTGLTKPICPCPSANR